MNDTETLEYLLEKQAAGYELTEMEKEAFAPLVAAAARAGWGAVSKFAPKILPFLKSAPGRLKTMGTAANTAVKQSPAGTAGWDKMKTGFDAAKGADPSMMRKLKTTGVVTGSMALGSALTPPKAPKPPAPPNPKPVQGMQSLASFIDDSEVKYALASVDAMIKMAETDDKFKQALQVGVGSGAALGAGYLGYKGYKQGKENAVKYGPMVEEFKDLFDGYVAPLDAAVKAKEAEMFDGVDSIRAQKFKNTQVALNNRLKGAAKLPVAEREPLINSIIQRMESIPDEHMPRHLVKELINSAKRAI